jgi:hypothetical protein
VITAAPPTSERRRREPSLWPLALIPIVGGLAVAGLVLIASRVTTSPVDIEFPGLDRLPETGRQPLTPIGVSTDACQYLDPVHVLAVELDGQWSAALSGGDQWPRFQAELAAELPQLELAVARAEPYVPEQIARRFEALARDLRLGVAELPREASLADVVIRPDSRRSPVIDGVVALADASDLVGGSCGYRLLPSNLLAP